MFRSVLFSETFSFHSKPTKTFKTKCGPVNAVFPNNNLCTKDEQFENLKTKFVILFDSMEILAHYNDFYSEVRIFPKVGFYAQIN